MAAKINLESTTTWTSTRSVEQGTEPREEVSRERGPGDVWLETVAGPLLARVAELEGRFSRDVLAFTEGLRGLVGLMGASFGLGHGGPSLDETAGLGVDFGLALRK